MDLNLEKLINALSELRYFSMHTTENTVIDLINRYNLLFLGSNFNVIYSHELLQSLKEFFNFDIEINELNKLLPKACDALQIKYEPTIGLSDFSDPNKKIYCYTITLW